LAKSGTQFEEQSGGRAFHIFFLFVMIMITKSYGHGVVIDKNTCDPFAKFVEKSLQD
jgi:hypothetical protein